MLPKRSTSPASTGRAKRWPAGARGKPCSAHSGCGWLANPPANRLGGGSEHAYILPAHQPAQPGSPAGRLPAGPIRKRYLTVDLHDLPHSSDKGKRWVFTIVSCCASSCVAKPLLRAVTAVPLLSAGGAPQLYNSPFSCFPSVSLLAAARFSMSSLSSGPSFCGSSSSSRGSSWPTSTSSCRSSSPSTQSSSTSPNTLPTPELPRASRPVKCPPPASVSVAFPSRSPLPPPSRLFRPLPGRRRPSGDERRRSASTRAAGGYRAPAGPRRRHPAA